MKPISFLVASALVFSAAIATAQPGPRAAMPCTSNGASAPGQNCGGPMSGRHALWGAQHTMGWSMMTAQEREAHRAKLSGITTYEECRAYMTQHHDEMVERAKSQGRSIPAEPRRDPCAPLKTAK